jgi:hypothetical protein
MYLFFSEIGLTETKLSIQDGILLVNGQVNIDGACLAQVRNTTNSNFAERLLEKIKCGNSTAYKNVPKTDREILLQKTKAFDAEYKNLATRKERATADKQFITDMEYFVEKKQEYRFFFEANARNFERQFYEDMGKSLNDCEINGTNLFKNMSTADKQRLHQQLDKHGNPVDNPATGKKDIIKYNSNLFNAAMKLANARGCKSVRDLVSYIGIVEYESRAHSAKKSDFINDVINETNGRLAKIQENINALMPLVEENVEDNKNHRG